MIYESVVIQKRYHLMMDVLIFSVLIALFEDQTQTKCLLIIKGDEVNASENPSSLQSNVISEYDITSKDFTIEFLAELLLCYLTGNIFGVEISCGRRADHMQMMYR